jgi:hypothetical protein
MSVDGITNIQRIQIALGDGAAFVDSLTINGDQEPVMALGNVQVILS